MVVLLINMALPTGKQTLGRSNCTLGKGLTTAVTVFNLLKHPLDVLTNKDILYDPALLYIC